MHKHVIPYLIYAAILIGLTAAIIIDFTTNPKVKAPSPQPPTSQPQPPAAQSKPNPPTHAPSPAPSGGASTPLANSGPGDVAAVFVGSAVAGAVGYSYYQRKKLA